MNRRESRAQLRSRQTGVSLVVGLIMLIMLTLVVVSGIIGSSINLRIAGNMQLQDEARASAQQAIEQFVSAYSNFYPTPTGKPAAAYDINNDGTGDFQVTVADAGVQAGFAADSPQIARVCERRQVRRVLLGLPVGSHRNGGRRQDRDDAGRDAGRRDHLPARLHTVFGRLLVAACELTERTRFTMLRKSIAKALLLGALALGFGVSRAEDIDIFSTNTTVSSEAPNVLIYIDNTANWSQSFGGGTKFSAEKAALTAVISALKSQFRLGIMMSTETGSGNSNTDGGYVRFAIQDMTDSAGQATPARDCLLRMVGAGNTCTLGNSTYYTNLDINARQEQRRQGRRHDGRGL